MRRRPRDIQGAVAAPSAAASTDHVRVPGDASPPLRRSQLEQLRSQLAAFADGDDWLDDDGGDDEWYQSPIDEEDEFRHFLNALHASRSLGDFDQLCASLGDAGRAQLQELGRHAEDPARLQKRNAETAAGNGA